MSKRFTATGKWVDPWFRRLSVAHKLFWVFLCDSCDNAGIWKVDVELASFEIGVVISEAEALKAFNEGKVRVSVLPGGVWFIVDFAEFQYGGFRKSGHAFHRKLVERIDTVSVGYRVGVDTPQDKDKDKEKDKAVKSLVTTTEIPAELNTPEFVKAWDGFCAHRKEIKKSMTARTETMALKHLVKMAGGQVAAAIKIVEQSIANGWQGLFELKSGGNNGRQDKVVGAAAVVPGKYDHLSR